jgi:hypothetical protein
VTYPGLGGQQPPPQNAAPAGQLVTGIQAGTTGQVVATRVIIVGAHGELLVYNPAIANGDLVASITGAGGTGLAGDTIIPGVVAYDSSGDYAQLFSAELNFFIIGMAQAASISIPSAGDLDLTSGLQAGGDIAATVIIQSADSAGGTTTITLSAGQVTVTGNLTVDGTFTASGQTGPPSDTGFFNTQGLASGSYGSTHQHTLPNFPQADHTHTL